MKKILLSTFVLCIAVFQLSAQNKPKANSGKNTVKPAAKPDEIVMKNLLDSFSYAAGVNVATNMKAQGISELNVAAMKRGIDDVFKGKIPLLTPEVSNSCMQKQLELFSNEKNAAEKGKGIAFLEENKKRPGVKTLPDGLQYEVIKNGDANAASPRLVDTVVVNYIGTLIDGTEFDNSFKRGEPAGFPVTGVIKGWTEILQLMKPGDHWKVYIPSDLAYGANGAGGAIPPNAALVFEIVLESIRPAVAVEAPKN